MAYRSKHYSDFVAQMAGLTGQISANVPTTELTIWNGFFNKAAKYIWQQSNWTDLCPYGEYRVPNNKLGNASRFDRATWTKTNATVSAELIPNPVDVQSNADLVLESSANSTHSVSQSLTLQSVQTGVTYSFSCFVQPAGRNYVGLQVTSSGLTTPLSVFSLAGAGSVVSSTSTVASATISQISGQWYQCTITFTGATALTTVPLIAIYSDGTTSSYAGDVTKGLYLWGASLVPTSLSGAEQQLIPWDQSGEESIDVVFDCWNMSPLASSYPSRVGFKATSNGVQVINSLSSVNAMYYVQTPQAASSTSTPSPLSPVYLYYRKRCPDYSGTDYSASATYAVNDQILFTASDGSYDYYKCLIATTAGQSPSTTAASWQLQSVPYAFFDYICYSAYADWLRADGQISQAQTMSGMAEDLMDRETDRQERQMQDIMPMRVSTHLTSRSTWA